MLNTSTVNKTEEYFSLKENLNKIICCFFTIKKGKYFNDKQENLLFWVYEVSFIKI